jgi:nitrate reductase gamma subunit
MLVVGVALKIRSYAGTPAPLKIPTTPAPTTTAGVALRLTREVVFFESLFKGNKWTWLFGWMFHFALLLVLLRHVRYFQQPVWDADRFVQPFGTYAGFAMVAGLAGLWARRFPGGPRALHQHAVGPLAPGAAVCHRTERDWACALSRTPTSSRSRPSCWA